MIPTEPGLWLRWADAASPEMTIVEVRRYGHTLECWFLGWDVPGSVEDDGMWIAPVDLGAHLPPEASEERDRREEARRVAREEAEKVRAERKRRERETRRKMREALSWLAPGVIDELGLNCGLDED